MKRIPIRLEEIADLSNLAKAAFAAAAGKRTRTEVRHFFQDLDSNLSALSRDILTHAVEVGRSRRFQIRDPKSRTIHAPCFRERVLHHAIMQHVGPVLDRLLVSDTFACRAGFGGLAAVRRCQQHIRRFPWYAKMDVRAYFASIDHDVLMELLTHRLKGRDALALLFRIINAHQDSPGRGLPIGALTSQCFANFYLAGLDRFLLQHPSVRGMVRYMDDFVLWTDDRAAVCSVAEEAENMLRDQLKLTTKGHSQFNRSVSGVTFCGFRVFPGIMRLTARRKRRFRHCLAFWEKEWRHKRIGALELQHGADAAFGIIRHADTQSWLSSLNLASRDWCEDV